MKTFSLKVSFIEIFLFVPFVQNIDVLYLHFVITMSPIAKDVPVCEFVEMRHL